MGLNALHHVTVKTNDLDATRDFYSEVLGLEVGFRPDLDFPGYWLYCGPTPVVHLVPRENAIGGGPSNDTGPFDHFAFLASDFDGIKPWCGLRPCSPDGLPYIGRTQKFENLCVATGHAMMGLSLGPVTGKIISDAIANRKSSIDLTLLDPDRYA